jgi:DNA-binding protein HU-beta
MAITGKYALAEQVRDYLHKHNKDERIKDLSVNQLADILDAVLHEMKVILEQRGEIRLLNFGSFRVRECAERIGSNPRTRERMTIPAKDRVRFRAGKELAAAVEGEHHDQAGQ